MTKIFLLLTFCFVFFSCNNDDSYEHDVKNILGRWEAIELISVESKAYQKDNNFNPVVEFKTDGTIGIQLDVNSCFSNYTLSDNSGINIEAVGCTEACCDSDFSVKVVEMLLQVTNYSNINNELKLNVPVWGWIKLVPLEQID